MREHAPEILLATTLLAVATAVALLLLPPRPLPSAEFQRIAGGLGLGPAATPERCSSEFDPRMDSCCTLGGDALPGGALFCPVHARPRTP